MSGERTLRLASWNIENLAPWLAEDDPAPLAPLVDGLGRPDVLCLQEIRVRPQDTELVRRMERAAPGYRCASSLARDPRNVTYRGGRAYGVATYVRDDVGRIASAAPAWDREGRALVTRLADLGLSVVNLYAVNGTSKPYWDHDRGAVVGDRHAFKRAVQDRLFELARGLAADGPVILAGDWNVSRTRLDVHPRLRTEEPHATARAQLEAHLAASGMVDVYRQLHPDERGYTWISRARPHRLDAARVDYAVVSAELAARVTDAAIVEPPLDRGRSDHRVVTVTVRL